MPGPWFYVLLGIIQGALEWLPVSSEGQLVVVGYWLNQVNSKTVLRFAIWLHFGTLIAVLLYYRETWKKLLFINRYPDLTYLRKFIIITTIGTALTGVPIRLFLIDKIEWSKLSSILLILIGLALIITAGLLYISDKNEGGVNKIENLTIIQLLIVGMAQGLSLIPGISRSGTTVSVLLLMKVNGKESFEGSFLMSVPAVLGAISLDILSILISNEKLIAELTLLGVFSGIFMAFVVGYLTMVSLLELARRIDFTIITFSLGILLIFISLIFQF